LPLAIAEALKGEDLFWLDCSDYQLQEAKMTDSAQFLLRGIVSLTQWAAE
jgi:hypothetical protein